MLRIGTIFRLLMVGLVVMIFVARAGDHAKVRAQQMGQPIVITGTYRSHNLHSPTGIVAEQSASSGLILLISETGGNVISVFSGGSLFTFAGNGTAGYVNGPLASAEFNAPTGLVGGYYSLDLHGTWYYWWHLQVNDSGNFVIRDICQGVPPPIYNWHCVENSSVSTYAGSGTEGFQNGSLQTAQFRHMAGLTQAGGYILDSENNAIRSINSNEVVTYAGNGTAGLVNGPVASAEFNFPTKAINGTSGSVLVVDAGNHCIRQISNGVVSTFAGTGQPGYQDGTSSVAKFYKPLSMIYNSADSYYYVTDTFNNCIRRIDSNGNVSTYAGSTTAGYQDGSLSSAEFNHPTDLSIANGVMYISDTGNNCIRDIVMSTGTVYTFID